MTVVQPGSFHGRDEELRTVRVWSSVGLQTIFSIILIRAINM